MAANDALKIDGYRSEPNVGGVPKCPSTSSPAAIMFTGKSPTEVSLWFR